MSLSPKLELRQGQSLVMTPQLLQAIKLLQMSQAELAAFIESEVEKNPLLEQGDGAMPEDADGAEKESGDWLEPSHDAGEIAAALDTDVENVFPEDDAVSGAPQISYETNEIYGLYWQERSSGGESGYEQFSPGEISLHEFLNRQLELAEGDIKRRFIGQQLIDLVDEAGYIGAPLEELAGRLAASMDEILDVLALLQSFDPPGICARNLQECLALQLKDKNRFDPAMDALLRHLDLVAKSDLIALRRHCGVDAQDLADMILELKRLDPKPGLSFGGMRAETLLPDVIVRRGKEHFWLIELNADAMPKLLVNERYASRISGNAKTAAEKNYVSACLQNASWLMKSLDQRAKTILKVASEIVRRQDAFLERGVAQLKPLNLREIADAISMHESTVSRVTANKYMETPRGIFEFRYFFSTAIGTHGGETVSSEAVRHRIKILIESETPGAVLSDDALVDSLRKEGIDIARRTVAKYRDLLGIPTSAERKRAKRVLATRS